MTSRLQLEVLLQAVDRASGPIRALMGNNRQLAATVKATRDQLKQLGNQQKQITAFRQLQQQTKATGASMRATSAYSQNLAQQINATARPSRALSREYQQVTRKAAQLQQQFRAQTSQLMNMRRAMNNSGIRNLVAGERQLKQQVDAATRALRTQEAQLARNQRMQSRMGAARSSYDRSMARVGGLTMAGASSMAAGGALLGATRAYLAPGIDFAGSMSKVQALTRTKDKNDPELQKVRQQAKDLGATTQYTATQVGDAQAFLAMAGFDKQKIINSTPGMLNLAKAGGMEDLARVADIATNIQTAFKLPAAEMDRIADTMTGAFTRSNVTMESLAETIKYAGTNASSVGASIEEVAAMTGLLGNVGTQGSMAGTALRSLYSRLAAPPAPAKKALAKIGVQAKDAAGNLRPVPDILKEIYEKSKNLGKADQLAIMKGIGGQYAMGGVTELVKQAGSGELHKFIETLENAKGEAAQVAKVMADNIGGDIIEFKSAFEAVSITLTETNEGPLRGIVQTAARLMRGLNNWIAVNPRLAGAIAKVVAVLGALLFALGGVAITIAGIIGPLAIIKYGMVTLGLKAASLVPIITGIVPAIKGLGIATLTAGRMLLTASVGPMIKNIGTAVMVAGRMMLASPIGLVITAIAAAAYLIYKNWAPIKAFFNGVFEGIGEALAPVLDGLRPLIDMVGDLISHIAGFLSFLIEPVNASEESLNSAASAGRLVGNVIGGVFSLLLTPIQLFIEALKEPQMALDFLTDCVRSWGLYDAMLAKWNAITVLCAAVWELIKSIPMRAGGAILNYFFNWKLFSFFVNYWSSIISWMANLPARFLAIGSQIIDGLLAGINSKWEAVKSRFSSLTSMITGTTQKGLEVHSPSRVFAGIGGYVMAGLAQGITQHQGGPLNAVQRVTQALTRAGAGISLPVMVGSLPRFDSRPPLGRRPRAIDDGGAPVSIQITVNAAPGMDEKTLAQQVAREVERLTRQQAARRRASLYDTD